MKISHNKRRITDKENRNLNSKIFINYNNTYRKENEIIEQDLKI